MINLFNRSNIKPTSRLGASLLALLMLGVSAGAQEKSTIQASFANNQTPVKIDVLVGQSRVIEFDQDYERLSISDPKIAEVVPHAHEWHLENAYIPLDVIAKLADRRESADRSDCIGRDTSQPFSAVEYLCRSGYQ